jgi:outer membrane protein assembly factor BamB
LTACGGGGSGASNITASTTIPPAASSAPVTIPPAASSAPVTIPPAASSAPVLSQLMPATAVAGCGSVPLTVIGSNFVSTSQIELNGNVLPTTYQSSTQLQAIIPAANITVAGSTNLTVSNGGAGVSNAMSFTTTNNTSTVLTTDSVAYQINAAHDGTASVNCPIGLPSTSAWSVNLGGAPSYALIAEGKVFVTAQVSGASNLIALDQVTGKTLWGPIVLPANAAIAYDAGQIFSVGLGFNSSNLMMAFNASNGNSNWSAALPGQYMFSAAPTAANGFVYTGGAGSGDTLYALNEATGALAWTQSVENGDNSSPAVTASGVYVSYPCQTYDFSPVTGTPIWRNQAGCEGGGGATPTVANNVLYSPNTASGYNGSIFNATTGAISGLGTYTADNPPAIGSSNGYFLKNGTLQNISLVNNSLVWSFAGDGGLTTSPVTVNQYTFIGSNTGNLYAVNNSTGQQAWVMNVGSAFPKGAAYGVTQFTGLAAGNGMLVVPAGNSLVAYSLIANQ